MYGRTTERHLFPLLILLLTIIVLVPNPVVGQSLPGLSEKPAQEGEEELTETVAVLPVDRANPRATMRTFLTAMSERNWDRAISTLDLRHENLANDVLAVRGREVAAQLKAVMDRVAYVRYEEIPEEMGGRSRYLWRTVEGNPIALERIDTGEWLFSRETIERLPDLLSSVEGSAVVEGVDEAPQTVAMWLREEMPPSLRRGGFILEYWQWIALAILIFAGVVVDRVLTFVLERIVAGRLAKRLSTRDIDGGLVHSAMRPFGLVAMAVLWWLALLVLGLPVEVLTVLLVAVKFVAIASIVWAAYRMVDILAAVLEHHAAGTETRYDDLLVPMLRKSAKIFIAAFGIVFLADNLNINITSLLAGLGIGGIAFALAAQDTVKNFFGSVTVLLDRPFQVGDWVVIDKIEGTVEELGFRSTRIRTFYNSLITLPNANLISAHVDNYGARKYRRWKTYLGVAYDTPPKKVDVLCEGIRELVRRHPYTRKDYFHVYLNQFGAHSLDILLYIFFETPDWATELRERHRLGVDILRLTQYLGVEIAFPTQTLYLKRGSKTEPVNYNGEYGHNVRAETKKVREDVVQLVDAALGGETPPPVTFDSSSVNGESPDDAEG
jgi:MscS family membrane protein